MVTMVKDFRSDVDCIIDGTAKKKPVKMKDSTFYSILPKCKKIVGGMYISQSGNVVEFK